MRISRPSLCIPDASRCPYIAIDNPTRTRNPLHSGAESNRFLPGSLVCGYFPAVQDARTSSKPGARADCDEVLERGKGSFDVLNGAHDLC